MKNKVLYHLLILIDAAILILYLFLIFIVWLVVFLVEKVIYLIFRVLANIWDKWLKQDPYLPTILIFIPLSLSYLVLGIRKIGNGIGFLLQNFEEFYHINK